MTKTEKKGKHKGGKRRQKFSSEGPSDSVIVYKGPIRLPSGREQKRKITVNLVYAPAVTSNASGVISLVVGNDMTVPNEVSNFISVYDEYRILGAEYKMIWNNNNTYSASLVQAPFITVIDRDSNNALPSVSGAYNYESAMVHASGIPFTREAKMSSIEDAQFRSTTPGTTSTFWFKMYGTGFTASMTYGQLFVTYLIQFRGRF